ncbi:MAG TPA: tyrosine-type recombinase/integrase [Planctomycetota bacterium]|nr:tyrosine-type recombinase/integrase [Planctomycetota bacterium]
MYWQIDAFICMLDSMKGRSRNTLVAYRADLRQLKRYLAAHDIAPMEVKPGQLQEYIDRAGKGRLSERTGARRVASTRAFYEFAHSRGWCNRNPASKLVAPKYQIGLSRPPQASEVEQLLAGTGGSDLLSLRDRVTIEIIALTGIRPSELVALDVSDVDCRAGTLRVTGSGANTRTVAIPPSTKDVLVEYVKQLLPIVGSDGPLFITKLEARRMHRTNVNIIINDYFQGSGTRITPTSLRHAVALEAHRKGANAQEIRRLLGLKSRMRAYHYLRLLKQLEAEAPRSK